MEPVYLKQLINSDLKGNPQDDVNSPFSFVEWKDRLPALDTSSALPLYNEYIIKWFQKNQNKPISNKFLLRQKYLYLLDQLELFFTTEEKNAWYSQINLADEKELLVAIPYFARKLKDIALYYLKLRQQLKGTKLKYNANGSVSNIEQQIYNYVLDTFSAKNNELTPHLYTTIPVFSALQQKLSVHVEELYDDHQYFDLSLTKPVSSYYDLMNAATANFLSTKGIVLSSAEWLFKSFNVPVSSNFDSVFSELTGNLFELTDTDTYNSYIQKFLGEDRQILTFSSDISTSNVYENQINEGNNFFYYPYGINATSFQSYKQLPIVALSSLHFENFLATDGTTSPKAGTTLEDSDIIFVKTGDITKSAWLRYQQYEDGEQIVKAAIKRDDTTSFIFPFPGYGLSGNNFPWTGSTFESTAEYAFLSKEYKAATENAYWSQTLPSDSCDSILLNNTSLADNGATAHANPLHADHFFIRAGRTIDTSVPAGETNGAWLYKFQKTALPVSPLQDNVFLWPYCSIDIGQDYPSHLTKLSFADVCTPASVQELPKSYFVAASSFDLADKIYKLHNYADDEFDALECVWLSGSFVQTANLGYIQQDGFNALFPPGEAIKFLWTGPETTLGEAFVNIAHRADCPFVTNSPAVSAFEWQKCTCKQVYHTPFGHPKDNFEEGNNYADCIIKVSDPSLEDFDFSSWKDSNDNTVYTSQNFAWYKTNSTHGWGDGKWISNVTDYEPFKLQPGQAYFYRRAADKINTEPAPSYSVSYTYNQFPKTKWIAAKKNQEGSWESAFPSVTSSMMIYPGDFIKISRQAETTSWLLSSYQVENTKTNLNSVWSTYDVIPVICGQNNGTTISWPSLEDPYDTKKDQYPSTRIDQISSIYGWTITRLENGESHSIYGVPLVTFVPPATGTYSVSVTANVSSPTPILSTITCTPSASAAFIEFAIKNDQDKVVSVAYLGSNVEIAFSTGSTIPGTPLVVNSIIPLITACGPYSTETTLIEFTTPVNGFVLEHTLKGWNYNIGKADTRAKGAKPYWATLDTTKSSTTRFKGLYSWGYPDQYIDEYIPNNNPIISPLELTYGTAVDYKRKGYSFSWVQPIIYKEYVNTTQWCQISAITTKASNLSALYNIKLKIDPVVIATTQPTDIQLSNLIDGSPTEIYYYALNSFVWPISVVTTQTVETPSASPYFISQTPWETMQNRFYPTVANIPVIEDTYSKEDVGGYFLPQNLGASLFVNKEFDVFLQTEDLSGTYLVEDTSRNVGGRGRSKQDQPTLYTWKENNQWIKESITTGDLAGAIKRDLTKVMQTFVPYQSNTDETALGLITNTSRVSPWGGYRDEEWTDTKNDPKSFTGVRNVSAWAASQVLKQTDKPIDHWSSDIFGNQYGLFKILDNVPVSNRKYVGGELWTRTNEQIVKPGYVSLSSVFDQFKFDSNVFAQLTGSGIKTFECYFDTIFIETDSIVIFAKIDYNYETGQIECLFDDTRYNYKRKNTKFEKNWFFSSTKKIISLYSELSAVGTKRFYNTTKTKVLPALYELDLVTRKETKIYPSTLTEVDKLTSSLTQVAPANSNDCSFYYNKSQNAFLLTYTGTDAENNMTVVDLTINYETPLSLSKIDYYTDLYDYSKPTDPPIVLNQYLTAINIDSGAFTLAVSALNEPFQCSLITYSTQISAITADGYIVFHGDVSPGLHHINYTLNNSVGDVSYCLTLSAL